MKDLIEALTIFLKYTDTRNPTGCEHDVMYIFDVTREQVSDADHARLIELGFEWDAEEVYYSNRFGSG